MSSSFGCSQCPPRHRSSTRCIKQSPALTGKLINHLQLIRISCISALLGRHFCAQSLPCVQDLAHTLLDLGKIIFRDRLRKLKVSKPVLDRRPMVRLVSGHSSMTAAAIGAPPSDEGAQGSLECCIRMIENIKLHIAVKLRDLLGRFHPNCHERCAQGLSLCPSGPAGSGRGAGCCVHRGLSATAPRLCYAACATACSSVIASAENGNK